MIMICPERNCPRRYDDKGNVVCPHAKPHDEQPVCREGCVLQDARGNDIWSDKRKPCVQWRGVAYAENAYKDAMAEAKEKRRSMRKKG